MISHLIASFVSAIIPYLIASFVGAVGFHALTYKFVWVRVKLDQMLDVFFKKST